MTYPTDYADPYEHISSEPEDYILAKIERENMYYNEIENFLNKHPECKDMSAKEIAKAMVIETIKRTDGNYTQEHYFKEEQNAKNFIEFMKSIEPEPNEYYLGSEYEIKFIGTEKYIK